MIGLPMGSHKTIVTQDGQLQWSQWSLANKGRAVLFGFSDQMDGALGIQLSEMRRDRRKAACRGRSTPGGESISISGDELEG